MSEALNKTKVRDAIIGVAKITQDAAQRAKRLCETIAAKYLLDGQSEENLQLVFRCDGQFEALTQSCRHLDYLRIQIEQGDFSQLQETPSHCPTNPSESTEETPLP